jgi:hypothetical protein
MKCTLHTGENGPTTAKKEGTEIMMRLSERSLELVTVFKEASRDLIIVFLFHKEARKLKTICVSTESTDLVE